MNNRKYYVYKKEIKRKGNKYNIMQYNRKQMQLKYKECGGMKLHIENINMI